MTFTPDMIKEAAQRLQGHIRRTPVMPVDASQLNTTGDITLKLEFLQHSGSFKGRGALNYMLANPIGPAGVVAASGGNHGGAVAWAASRLGHRAAIFVPTISAPVKVNRLHSYQAEVHQVGAVYAEALAASKDLIESTGASSIHAYEDPAVMAGAGTTALELESQLAEISQKPADTVLVACGGGGLAGGMATWLAGRTQVVACETSTTRAYAAAVDAGKPVDVEVSGIAADALGATRIGDLAFQQLQAANAQSVVVSDDEVEQARQLIWNQFRILTEPSAAVPVAALISGRYRPAPNSHTVVVICGANTEPAKFVTSPQPTQE